MSTKTRNKSDKHINQRRNLGFFVIFFLSGLIARGGPWYLLFWKEDAAVISTGACIMAAGLILVTLAAPYVAWAICYREYLDLAKAHSSDISGVKYKHYGNPLPRSIGVLIIAFLILWSMSLAMFYFAQHMDLRIENDQLVLKKLFVTLLASLLADLSALALCDARFKPGIVAGN